MLLSRGGFTIFGGLIVGTIAGLFLRARRSARRSRRCWTRSRPRSCCRTPSAASAARSRATAIGASPLTSPPNPDGCQPGSGRKLTTATSPASRSARPASIPTPIYEVLMSFVAFAVLWRLRRHRIRVRLAVLPLSAARWRRAPGCGKHPRQHDLQFRRTRLHPGAAHRHRLHASRAALGCGALARSRSSRACRPINTAENRRRSDDSLRRPTP